VSLHTERFTGREAVYAEYRERYDPAIVLPLLRDWCGLSPHWIVADIGAGTGMLSDVFLANGNPVIAVEPNMGMRTTCADLHAANPLLTILDGTAEATGLEDASVDMVSVGRALHWFDIESAMQEFRRILKPGGWVAIVAFGRSKEGREENEAFEDLLRPYTTDGTGTHATYGVYKRLKDLFPSGELRHMQILGEMQLDWPSLRGLTLSLSHAPLPEAPNFAAFDSALADYFDHFQNAGKVTLATGYWINAGRLIPTL
jgi:ubiquinone/menaquinone biosynthesis C-methylase UbiE